MSDVQVIDRDGRPLVVDVRVLTELASRQWGAVTLSGDVDSEGGAQLDVRPEGGYGFVVTVTRHVAWCDGTSGQTAEMVILLQACVRDPSRLILVSDDASLKRRIKGVITAQALDGFVGWEPVTEDDVMRWDDGR